MDKISSGPRGKGPEPYRCPDDWWMRENHAYAMGGERERGETRWMFPKWISGTNYKDKFFCFVFCLEEKDKFKSPTLSWYVPIQTNMYIYSTLHFYVNISLSRFSETFFYLFSFLYFCSDQMKIVWCTLVTKKILLCQNKQAAAGRRR